MRQSRARYSPRPSSRRRALITLDAEHVALSFRSEQHQLLGGELAPAGFAPLSRFLRCNDGWARTHGNYPHHAAALARGLELGSSAPSAQRLESVAVSLSAGELEQRVVRAGGCAAALRTEQQWSEHPAGAALAATPLVDFDDALTTERRPAPVAAYDTAPSAVTQDRFEQAPSATPTRTPVSAAREDLCTRPCSGLRVLDLTRVIAGPVAGRTLAALGADVLRVDPPGIPELPVQHRDMGPGKRSALLDLADVERREALLDGADVLLVGYRPGSLARFDLTPDALAERHPRLVQVWLSAWGATGPWAERRGFDSLVQVASGIAVRCAREDGTPGALPAQALDHGTGHLIAAAALRALAARTRSETIAPARLALARTAKLLLDAPAPSMSGTEQTGRADPARHRVRFDELELIAPPGELDHVPLRWLHGPRPLGGDPPAWW